MVRRRLAIAAAVVLIAGTGACGQSGGTDSQLTPGDRAFCDTAAKIVPSPRATSGVDLDQKLGEVSNKDLQKFGSGVREKSPSEARIIAKDIVAKCADLGYQPPAPTDSKAGRATPAASTGQVLGGLLTATGAVQLDGLRQFQPTTSAVTCIYVSAGMVQSTISYQKPSEPGKEAARLNFVLPSGRTVTLPSAQGEVTFSTSDSSGLYGGAGFTTRGTATLAADAHSGSVDVELRSTFTGPGTGSVHVQATFTCVSP